MAEKVLFAAGRSMPRAIGTLRKAFQHCSPQGVKLQRVSRLTSGRPAAGLIYKLSYPSTLSASEFVANRERLRGLSYAHWQVDLNRRLLR